jgi:hypothetical protein
MASPKPTPKPKVMAKPTAKATVKPKPKATPVPKFTAPSVAEFRQSAAYKTDSMGYKEYVDTMYQVYQAKNKKK